MSEKKIFVIGFSKCGTTSIHELFKFLNINSTHQCHKIPVLEIIDKFDAFTDGKHYNFEKYYEKYPNSLFILNTRPIYNWLSSRYRHGLERGRIDIHITDTNTLNQIILREEHYNKVINFFSDKLNQLLIVNIEKQGFENSIVDFIGKEKGNYKFKRNVGNPDKIQKEELKQELSKLNKIISTCLQKLGYKGNELLFKNDIDVSNYKTYL